MSGRDVTGATLVVVLAVIVFLGALAWGLLPYLTSTLEHLQEIAR
jgi:hypothetical protein